LLGPLDIENSIRRAAHDADARFREELRLVRAADV